MKKDWKKLTDIEQKVFKDKAEYLIERGYVQGKTTEELAKEIYRKELM
jgi:ribonucleotide reductase beta subunit family protein with ferritin-like domain